MIDWTASMKQTFEYYVVDPDTWRDKEKIDCVVSSSLVRDVSAETLGSASFEVTEQLNECYIRIYLIVTQFGVTYNPIPIGTYLVQTPSFTFNGHYKAYNVDAYTPLLELKENPVPLGFTVMKNQNILENVVKLTNAHMRAPVVETTSSDVLYTDFTANTDDTWMSFLTSLIAKANYRYDLDFNGNVLFDVKKELDALQPVWTFTDDNSSILYPNATLERDLYGIPNVVEVIYSSGGDYFFSRAVNDDPESPTSTITRGREIIKRVTNPSDLGRPTQEMLDEYAVKLLKNLSTIEYTITYSHGYCPVRVGDCVRFNYKRAGLENIKAVVTYQSIACKPGIEVQEKAVYTMKLWEG